MPHPCSHRRPILSAGLALSALLPWLGSSQHLHAMPPPPKGALEVYQKDGSLQARQAFAKKIGNHRIDPTLLEAAHYRLRKQLMKQSGATEDRIRKVLTPPPAWRGMPTKGTVNVLVIGIDFSDYPANTTVNSVANMQARIFGDGQGTSIPYDSLRNFYLRSSYGQLTINGTFPGWYRAGARSAIAQTHASRENLIKAALQHFDAQGLDFSQFDNNDDGKLDYIAIIWAGPHNGWGNFWWGYQTSWWATPSPVLDGKTIGDYSWQWESYYSSTPPANRRYSPSTLIHETGHALGLPDYYDYDEEQGPSGGVGGLDQMDGYGDHNAFSKWVLDWITPTVVTGAAANQSLRDSSTHPDALILLPEADPNAPFGEYFTVQNRRRTGNDVSMPGDGLLIWHVDARLDANNFDYRYDNSYTSHKLLRLMEADGLEEIERDLPGDSGDYWTTGQTFGPAGTPNSNFYDGLFSYMGVNAIAVPAATATFNVFREPGDSSAPTGSPTAPVDEGVETTSDRLAFTWSLGSSADPESAIAGYYLQVGSSPGGSDVYDGRVGNSTSAVLMNRGWHGATFHARVRAMNGAGLYSAWSPTSDGIRMSFSPVDGAALDNAALDFRSPQPFPWTVQSTVVHTGPSAAQSAAIPDNRETQLQTRVTGPGFLYFYWKVSSEQDWDFLRFYIDGTEQRRISGNVDWTQEQLTIPAGTHTLRWLYTKDENTIGGQDTGWLDTVAFVPAGPTALAFTQQPTAQTVTVGGTASFTVAVTGGTTPYTYQWKKDGTNLPSSNAATYTLTNAQTTHAGSYTCTVTDAASATATSNAALLTVNPASTVAITLSPTTATMLTGAARTFQADVTGTANTAVTWTFTGGSVNSATANPVTFTAPAAAGTYLLTATSSADPAKSATATVTVNAMKSRDLNSDSVVDVRDMAHMARAYGKLSTDPNWATYAPADLNWDDKVDDDDITLLLAGL